MRNRSENKVEIVFIRHGRTPANKEHRYLGKTDESLSPEGIEALRQEKAEKIYPEIDYLFASPMKRCIETADILYPGKDPILVPQWKEMDFGLFEGKNYQELNGDKQYQAWIDSGGTMTFPQGESRPCFLQRCSQGMYESVDRYREFFTGGVKIGCVVHGGTIMALLSIFYGGEYFDYQVKNGRGYCCMLSLQNGRIYFTELRKL
jgi:alpha-ribazole phosphatase